MKNISLKLVCCRYLISRLLLFEGKLTLINTESKVNLDHFENVAEDTLQINFNITFARLKCEYASVDATNFMGTHDAGLAARVSKVRLKNCSHSLYRRSFEKVALQCCYFADSS